VGRGRNLLRASALCRTSFPEALRRSWTRRFSINPSYFGWEWYLWSCDSVLVATRGFGGVADREEAMMMKESSLAKASRCPSSGARSSPANLCTPASRLGVIPASIFAIQRRWRRNEPQRLNHQSTTSRFTTPSSTLHYLYHAPSPPATTHRSLWVPSRASFPVCGQRRRSGY
jgi:hypothetical protein